MPTDRRCRQPVILSPLLDIRLLDWTDLEGFGSLPQYCVVARGMGRSEVACSEMSDGPGISLTLRRAASPGEGCAAAQCLS
jgi:hypothetical protein